MEKDLEQRTKRFALQAIKFVSLLPRTRDADILGRQLLRSATSIGANYREANRAVSRRHLVVRAAPLGRVLEPWRRGALDGRHRSLAGGLVDEGHVPQRQIH